MIFVALSSVAAPMCLGPKIEQMGLHLSGSSRGDVGGEFLFYGFFSRGFLHLFIYICFEKEFCLRNWNPKNLLPNKRS